MYPPSRRRSSYSFQPEQPEDQIVLRTKLDQSYCQGQKTPGGSSSDGKPHRLSRKKPSWEFQARNYRRTRAQVKHFSHSHPLGPFEVEKEDGIICCGCELGLDGSAYGCLWCNFFLHKKCFELPTELTSSSHPHPLNLHPRPPEGHFTCHSCNDYGGGFVYSCSSCKFDFHVDCVKP